MTNGKFRLESVLNLYRTQEDALRQEILSIEWQRREARQELERLVRRRRELQNELARPDPWGETGTVLEYLEALLMKIQEKRTEEGFLQRRAAERREVLQKIRRERMRYGKLKEHHDRQTERFERRLEQKVTDEFAQRKNPV
jgi:flagellar export protein FliJ